MRKLHVSPHCASVRATRPSCGEVSLASIASWADDYRVKDQKTYNWHFVDIPYEASAYDPDRDCKLDPQKGDCIINAIERQRTTLGVSLGACLFRSASTYRVGSLE